MKQSDRWWWHDLLLLVLLMVAVTVAWSSRIGGGDTYVSLAAGRDVLAGKIGLPDEWSFATEGRVWLNQNWGAHTTYYVSHRLFGDAGPVAVKWLVLFGVVLLMVRAATMRGASRPLAVTVIAVAILVPKTYLDVRPHIFTLLFEGALIVSLFKWSTGSSTWAFVGMVILWMWSNFHGGFVFGLGVMALWVGVQVFLKLVRPTASAPAWWRLILLGIALGGAALLAALANPFGPINLTHPLVVQASPVWLSVQEWHPIVDWKTFKLAQGFGSTTEFLVMMGFLGATVVGWLLGRGVTGSLDTASDVRTSRDKGRRGRTHPLAGRTYPEGEPVVPRTVVWCGLFDLALTAGVIVMAFKARRFIPLATVAVAPIMAAMLEDMLRRFKRLGAGDAQPVGSPAWRLGLIGLDTVLLLVGAWLVYGDVYFPYRHGNPYYPEQSVLMRMVGSQTFPERAMDFLIHNEVPPEVFVDWRWEGYTRWRTDRLKPFSGGRAQQIHSERVASWQIGAVEVGATPLRIGRVPEGSVFDTGQLIMISGQKDGTLAELRVGETPLAKLTSTIDFKNDGQTIHRSADRTVSWKIAEITEFWVDIDVAVEATAEPKFTAEYRLTLIADPLRPEGAPPERISVPSVKVTLTRLKNTGASAFHVSRHAVVMTSLHPGDRPVRGGPMAFWQSRDLRFGLGACLDGTMTPQMEQSGPPMHSQAWSVVDQRLHPGEAYTPSNASILSFVHRVGPSCPSQATFDLLQRTQAQNCRRVVDQADQWGIKTFVLARRAWPLLARVLIGSRRWVCVFDDGAAYVLLSARHPRCRQIIADVLAGRAWYPDEYLKALGRALARYSVGPINADPAGFRQDLKAALEIQPHWLGYGLLQGLYLRDPREEVAKEALVYWATQWERVAQLPVDVPLGREVYQCRQIIADALAHACARLGQSDKATQWKRHAKDALDRLTRLQKDNM